MSIRTDFLKEIEAFLAKHEMSATTLGVEALGDSAFMIRLRAGRNIGIETVDKVRAFMRTYQPKPQKRDKPRRGRKTAEALAPA